MHMVTGMAEEVDQALLRETRLWRGRSLAVEVLVVVVVEGQAEAYLMPTKDH